MPPHPPSVELVYHRGCANVAAARALLHQALARVGRQLIWDEWCTDDAGCPDRLRRFPSPTILVAGRDVAGAGDEPAVLGSCCRLYPNPDGSLTRVPSLESVVAALTRLLA